MIENTLNWGISLEEIKTFFPDVYIGKDGYGQQYLGFNLCYLHNFPNDCGATILTGLTYVTAKSLEAVHEYCSRSGFNLIFGTLVSNDIVLFKQQLNMFRKFGWKVVCKGPSNRNPNKKHATLVKKIQKPLRTGY